MDILSIELTIKEFQIEWRLKYTVDDVVYWAPRLDSDILAEAQCAVMMFEAWGRETFIEHYQKWKDLVDQTDEVAKKHKESVRRSHYNGEFCCCYDCEDWSYAFGYRNGRKLSRRDARHADGDYTDYEISQMTWKTYLESILYREM